MISKLRSIYTRFFRKKICTDCKNKLDRHFGLKSRIKHKVHRIKHRFPRTAHTHSRRSKHKLRAGIHKVKIRGKLRKVKVLANGQWRFLKSR